ncbi:unnamed protein product, partial [marine sediment metagenome]
MHPPNYKLLRSGLTKFAIGAVLLFCDIFTLIVLVEDALGGKYLNDTITFIREMIVSISALSLDIIMIITGVYEIFEAFGKLAPKLLDSVTKFLGKIAFIIGFVLLVVDWIFFIHDYLGGKFTQSEFVIGLTLLISETIMMIGVGIALGAGWTGVGAIIGGVLAAFGLI